MLAEKKYEISHDAVMVDYAPRPVYEFIKRICDVLLSAAALAVLSPLLLITAIAVRSDGHKAIYAQTRIGKDGRPFKMYKFRSMCPDAESRLEELLQYNNYSSGPAFKMHDDPRITRVGKFIRKYSIDELPQLVNIIKGDMSIVGPRPPLPREVEQYNDYQKQRLLITPGLTCYWQTYGRSDLSFDDWMAMDMKYIQNRSLMLDIELIIKTIFAVLFKRGAY